MLSKKKPGANLPIVSGNLVYEISVMSQLKTDVESVIHKQCYRKI